MTKMPSSLLFKDSRHRVLRLLLLRPAERYHVREIARLTNTVAGTINKELRTLADACVLVKSVQGNQVLYQANTDYVIFDELVSILRKTSGLETILSEALHAVAGQIDTAFVFGSVAAGTANANSDIDLCIVGEVSFTDAVHALYPIQEELKREINPQCFSKDEWLAQCKKPSAFFKELMTRDVINIIGNRDDIN